MLRRNPRSFKAAAALAHISAVLFIAGAVLTAISRGIANGSGGIGFETIVDGQSGGQTETFFEEYSKKAHLRWQHRRQAQSSQVVGLLSSLLGWAAALPAVSTLAHVLGGPDNSATAGILYPFVVASILAIVEFSAEAGTAMTSNWMSQWPVLSNSPERAAQSEELSAIQAFEISYFLAHSRTLWLYALDNLLLATTLATAAFLTSCDNIPKLSKKHAALGLLGAVICVCEFAFEVTRFINWKLSVNASIVATLAIDAVVLPLWLAWLAQQLYRMSPQNGHYTASNLVDPVPSGWPPEQSLVTGTHEEVLGDSDLEKALAASMHDQLQVHDQVRRAEGKRKAPCQAGGPSASSSACASARSGAGTSSDHAAEGIQLRTSASDV